jgi:hypothetical protein
MCETSGNVDAHIWIHRQQDPGRNHCCRAAPQKSRFFSDHRSSSRFPRPSEQQYSTTCRRNCPRILGARGSRCFGALLENSVHGGRRGRGCMFFRCFFIYMYFCRTRVLCISEACDVHIRFKIILRDGKPAAEDVPRVCREVVTTFALTSAGAKFREQHSPDSVKLAWAAKAPE